MPLTQDIIDAVDSAVAGLFGTGSPPPASNANPPAGDNTAAGSPPADNAASGAPGTSATIPGTNIPAQPDATTDATQPGADNQTLWVILLALGVWLVWKQK